MIAGDFSPPTDCLEDEFLTWLNRANAGMLELGNLYLMDYALFRLPSDSPVLEFGSSGQHSCSNRLFCLRAFSASVGLLPEIQAIRGTH
jgi:hypothetical protein